MGAGTSATLDPMQQQLIRSRQEEVLNQERLIRRPIPERPTDKAQGIEFGPGRSRRITEG